MQIKLIFIRMVLGLLWKWEFLELGNGLLRLEKLCHEDIALLGQFCVKSLPIAISLIQNAPEELLRTYQTSSIRKH